MMRFVFAFSLFYSYLFIFFFNAKEIIFLLDGRGESLMRF